MKRQAYDVVIVDGAIMGSAVAYFLKRLSPACRVVLVEADETYEFASTLRASGGVSPGSSAAAAGERGPVSTSRTSWTAIPSSAHGRTEWRTSSS
jgi:glycine/D-amino acid oxidase-like deaminating enzyme